MQRFTVTDQHLALLRRASVRWDEGEFGAPAIDCKRPYGSSDVIEDIGDTLGFEHKVVDDWGEPAFAPDVEAAIRRIHRETGTALQIVLATGTFEAGQYVADDYTRNWRRASI